MQRDRSGAMSEDIQADICVIGAGSAGLSVAAGAAQLGARTVLIEAQKMGGDCLNTGCVPSKSLLAAAKAAKAVFRARRFGVLTGEPKVDFEAVNAYVRGVIDAIAPHDSIERFTGLGCIVIEGRARFVDPRTVEAAGKIIRARRFVIATGSRAAVPPIPGLNSAPYFTNETIFDNKNLPRRLLVIGAGPIGCELAQAHRRLGAQVSLFDLGPLLPKDDPDAAAVIRDALMDDGIDLHESVEILRVETRADGVAIVLRNSAGESAIEGSHLLVAAGRKPNVEDLGLEAAGVRYSPKGVETDARLRTSNKRIFAAGDVVGGLQFTHLASYHAGIVIRNALFRLPAKSRPKAFPWVTYTDPELAQVGLTKMQAREGGGDIRILRADFADNDRARAESETRGFLEVMVAKSGHVLGATIVGHNAGELITPWTLAISEGLKIGALANLIVPYPTLSEISKRAAGAYYTPALFSARMRALVRFLGVFG
jgi:pyruvate/2-oxoglutarate dehydrogenase complex dihydrolipoamide dehydrogenase (E3) component